MSSLDEVMFLLSARLTAVVSWTKQATKAKRPSFSRVRRYLQGFGVMKIVPVVDGISHEKTGASTDPFHH